jgi:hypothetical protein
MAQSPQLSNEIKSTHVMVRFVLRLAILGVFASLGNAGFAKGFAVLSLMSAAMCVTGALLQREAPLATALNHWDEAAAYGALCALTISAAQLAVS